jgi:hypothetical protein
MTHDGTAFGRGFHDEQDFVAITVVAIAAVIVAIVVIVGHM